MFTHLYTFDFLFYRFEKKKNFISLNTKLSSVQEVSVLTWCMAWSVTHVLPSWSIVSPWGIKNLDEKKRKNQKRKQISVRRREGRERRKRWRERAHGRKEVGEGANEQSPRQMYWAIVWTASRNARIQFLSRDFPNQQHLSLALDFTCKIRSWYALRWVC